MNTAKSWETCITNACKKPLKKLVEAECKKRYPDFIDYEKISNDDGEIREWVKSVVYKGNKPLLADFVGCVISDCPTSEKITTDIIDMVKIVKTNKGDDKWSKSVINKCKKDYNSLIENRAKECDAQKQEYLSNQEKDQFIDEYAKCIVGNKMDSTLGKWFGCHILQSKKQFPQKITENIIDTLKTFIENVKKNPIEKDPTKWEKCITKACKIPLNELIKEELKKENPNFEDYKKISDENGLKAWAKDVVEHGNKDLLAEWFGCLIAHRPHSEKVTKDIIDMVKIVKKGGDNDELFKCVTENCKGSYDKWKEGFMRNKEGNKEKECDAKQEICLYTEEENQCLDKHAKCIIDGGKGKNFDKLIGCQVAKCNQCSKEVKQGMIDTLGTFVKNIKEDPTKWEECITNACKRQFDELVEAGPKGEKSEFEDYKSLSNDDEKKTWAENVVKCGDKTLLAKWFGCLIGQCAPPEKITANIVDMVKIVKTNKGGDEWSESLINNCGKDYEKWIKHFKHDSRGNRAEKCDIKKQEYLSDQEKDQFIDEYAKCIVGDGRDRMLGNWVGCQILKCEEYPQKIEQSIIDTLETFVKGNNKIESTSTGDFDLI